MIRLTASIVLVCTLNGGQKSVPARALSPTAVQGGVASASAVAVAREFLPPRSQLATLYTFNYHTLNYGPDFPAVLQAHITSPKSVDIIFAYYSPRADTMTKTLFLDLIEKTPRGYEKIFEVSYRPQILFVSKAIRLVHLDGIRTDAVAVMHGIGADLGGSVDVLVWNDPWGWRNIFPANGGIHYFYFFAHGVRPEVALSSSKHPGLEVTPAPVWYRWDGRRFVRIPPPRGSSSWPLPD
jgi:hypothetical protein